VVEIGKDRIGKGDILLFRRMATWANVSIPRTPQADDEIVA
jgi:hypothetical protein